MSWPDDLAERFQRFSRQASAFAMSSALGPSGVAGFRQQQPRFQIGEPRRHHQIVGGKLEAQLPRLLDEGEILVGQRQDRDLRRDRPSAGGRAPAADRAGPRSPRRRPSAPARRSRARRSSVSNASASLIRRSRAVIMAANSRARRGKINRRRRLPHSQSRSRRAAPPRRQAPAPRAATARISSSLPLQCSTTSQPAASAARARSAIDPDSAPIEMSSLINSPSKPMKPRITSPIIVAEVVAGCTGSIAVNTTWAVIANGKSFQRTECGEIGGLQRCAVGVHHRQLVVAVGVGAAVAGDVLEHRQHAAVRQALGDGGGDRRDLVRRRRHRRGRRSPGRRR